MSLLLRTGEYCREPRETRGSYFNREHRMELQTAAPTMSQLHNGICLLCANRIRERMENTPAPSARDTSGSFNPRSCLEFPSALQ